MMQGRSIQDLAAELTRQQEAKKDIIADTSKALMTVDQAGDLGIQVQVNGGHEAFGINDLAHKQLADRLKIPAKYYDRMRNEDPELLALNVNNWFQDQPKDRMFRTLDGNLRAVMSNRYQRIDHLDLLRNALPILSDLGGEYQIQSCEVTERRMYIQIVTPLIEADVKPGVGDRVQAGFIIGNSEVGLGSVFVEQLVWRLVCLNGMRIGESLKRRHVGGRQDEGVLDILSDETMRLEDAALTSRLRDVMAHCVTHDALQKAIAPMQDAADRPIEGQVIKAAEVLSQKVGLTESEGDMMLQHLIQGGDLSQWGAANAVTRLAHDAADYDRAFELEGLGGQVINLSNKDWQEVALAA